VEWIDDRNCARQQEMGGMSMSANDREPRQEPYLTLGVSLGLLFGSALGVVLGLALDNMAFMAIGVGTGLTMGLSIGTALQEGHKEDRV
jgi:hypothetical protein